MSTKNPPVARRAGPEAGTRDAHTIPPPPDTRKVAVTGADLLDAAGLTTLGERPAPAVVERALRRLAELVAAHELDALARETVRLGAVDALRAAGVASPARMVDAALPPPPKDEGAPSQLQGRAVALDDPEPWPEPVDGAALLDELAATFRRFVALPEGADTALALWVIHAHAHDAAEVSPILALTSATPRCGKSTTLAIVGALVPRPLPAASISAAVLFRAVELYRPTLLIDEADTLRLGDRDDMRGLLNAGHTRASAYAIRAVGDDHEPRVFRVWAPKAVALIGRLPDTLADRSVIIPLRRRAPGETVERLRIGRIMTELEPLRRKAARWAQDQAAVLADADPDVPAELHDRAADNWRPLIAIADAAGGDWPERARRAARILSGAADPADEGPAVQLLADLRALFDARGVDRLASAEIVDALAKMEDRPWPEWKAGRPITARQLARLLAPFGIRPTKIRFGDATSQGYSLEAFEDAFRRYLPRDPEQPEHSRNGAENPSFAIWNNTGRVPDRESGENPHDYGIVPDVPDRNPRVAGDDALTLELEGLL